jgi:hypothetical protein
MQNQLIHSKQDGFTMIEMVIATIMLLTLSFLVTNMIISGNDAHKYADRLGRATEITQETLDDISAELQEAVRLFEDDTLGQAYAACLQPWPEASPLGSSRMPRFKLIGILDKDLLGSEMTGNDFMFVRHAWVDTFNCSSGQSYSLDVYRLVRYYMKVEGDGPTTKNPYGLNLVKWTSEPVVSGAQLDKVSDAADLWEILTHLHDATPDASNISHSPINLVWMLDQDPSELSTFRQILSDGTLTDFSEPPRAEHWEFERDDQLSSPGLLFYRHHSVATNYSQSNQGGSRVGIRNDSTAGVGFPHGFEIQVVGSAAARKVLIHMTTVSTNAKGLRAFYDGQAVVVVREG